MEMDVDLRVVELLASRLCHDLVGPVGAVNNGLELLEDDLGETGAEALRLAADSGARAARALQYFRLAYGMAGSRVGGRLDEVRELCANFLGTGKVTLTWDLPATLSDAPEDLAKLLLNMILLGAEALPYGGTLAVTVAEGPGGVEARVAASGDRAALRQDTRPALADRPAPQDLTPRNVQAYFTRLIARRMGADLVVDTSAPAAVTFRAALPR